MPPVTSKPTSQTELSQVLNKDKVDEYAPSSVDSNLAHIIMTVAKRLRSSTIGKKKKKENTGFLVPFVQRMSRLMQLNVITVIIGLMLFAMPFLSQNMKF